MQFSLALVAAIAGVVVAAPGEYATYPASSPVVPTYPVSTAPSAASTAPCEETSPAQTYPAKTHPSAASTYPIASSYVASSPSAEVSTYVASTPAAGVSTYAASVPAAGVSTYAASVPAAGTSAAASYSIETISTCVPTVIYSTVTVPAASAPPYPTGTVPSVPAGHGTAPAASGTGSVYPSYPVSPAIGAGSSLTSPIMGVAAAAIVAVFLA